MRRTTSRVFFSLLLAAGLGACGSDTSAGPGDDVEGLDGGDASVDVDGGIEDAGTDGGGTDGGETDGGGTDGGGTDVEPDIDPTLDRDNDGLPDLDEVTIWGTSPTVADTDGDGFSDKQEVIDLAFDPEVNNFQFNPLVADRPILDIELALAPVIYATYETTEGTTESVGSERSNETRNASTSSWGGSNSYSVEQSHTVGATVGFSGWSLEGSVSYEYSYSTTSEESSNWSTEQTEENAQTLTAMTTFEESNEITSSGGVLGITVRVANRGNIAYFLDNLTLTAYELDPLDPENTSPISALTFLDGADTFPRTRLEPGETSSPLAFDAELDLPTVKALLADSRNLMIAVATSLIEGDGTVDFELAATSVNARTAEVIIDYGFDRAPESYRVSTVAREGETSVTVDEVLTDILRIPYAQGTTSFRYAVDEEPRDTLDGLLSVRGFETEDDTATLWTVVHSYPINNGADTQIDQYHPLSSAVDFGALELQKGHVLQLIRIVDADRDGLGERSEYAYGTDPANPDTDNDGCTDGFEVAGWTVGEPPNQAFYRSSPLLPNTDFDLFNDCEEYEAGTNPADADNTPPTASVVVGESDGVRAVFEVTYGDAETDVLDLTYTVDDGAPVVLDVSGETSPASIEIVFDSSGPHTFEVTAFDGALRSDPAVATYTVQAPSAGLASYYAIAGDSDDRFSGVISDSGGSFELQAQGVRFVTGRDGLGRSGVDVRPEGDSGILYSAPRDLGDDFTVAFWISVRDVYSLEMVTGQAERFVVATDEGSTMELYDMRGDTFPREENLIASGAVTWEQDGMYHLVVVTVSGGTATLYLDGESAGSGEISALPRTDNCELFFGDVSQGNVRCGNTSPAESFENGLNASFDDMRVYSRALSPNEVRALAVD